MTLESIFDHRVKLRKNELYFIWILRYVFQYWAHWATLVQKVYRNKVYYSKSTLHMTSENNKFIRDEIRLFLDLPLIII